MLHSLIVSILVGVACVFAGLHLGLGWLALLFVYSMTGALALVGMSFVMAVLHDRRTNAPHLAHPA